MKVLIVYYSMYGHVLQLAKAVEEGARSVKGVEVILRRVQEFDVVDRIIDEDKAASKVRAQQKDIPVCTVDDLGEADGVIFGTPTRYGNMTAQMKQLIDSTGRLWLQGKMEGKPAGIFTSTASTHGGQETTPFTMMAPLLHLGMIIVGVPYSVAGMLHTEGRGGHTVRRINDCRTKGRASAKARGSRDRPCARLPRGRGGQEASRLTSCPSQPAALHSYSSGLNDCMRLSSSSGGMVSSPAMYLRERR